MGLGRIYVKLDEGQPLDFDNWIQGVKLGRSYVGDGMSHLIDFKVNDVAAILEPEPVEWTERIRNSRLDNKPYWHVERSRIADTRKVPVELIVNGEVAAVKEVYADGAMNGMEFDVDIDQSSWVALRILPSAQTNPVFIEVDGKPIRANKRSAQWCVDAVDTCWESKKGQIEERDLEAAKLAYDQAKEIYRKIREES